VIIYFLICEYFRLLVCVLCGKFIFKCSLNYKLYDTLLSAECSDHEQCRSRLLWV